MAGCVDLLEGGAGDPELIAALACLPEHRVCTEEPPRPAYWLRIWAARGLLWAWDDVALEPLKAALHDEAWRVREMALKVVARHSLDDALERLMRGG